MLSTENKETDKQRRAEQLRKVQRWISEPTRCESAEEEGAVLPMQLINDAIIFATKTSASLLTNDLEAGPDTPNSNEDPQTPVDMLRSYCYTVEDVFLRQRLSRTEEAVRLHSLIQGSVERLAHIEDQLRVQRERAGEQQAPVNQLIAHSADLRRTLRDKKTAFEEVSTLIAKVIPTAGFVQGITSGRLENVAEYGELLLALHTKLRHASSRSTAGDETATCAIPDLMRLKFVAIGRVREFLLAQVRRMDPSKVSLQLTQRNLALRFAPYHSYLAAFHPHSSHIILGEYRARMSKVYTQNVKMYLSLIEKRLARKNESNPFENLIRSRKVELSALRNLDDEFCSSYVASHQAFEGSLASFQDSAMWAPAASTVRQSGDTRELYFSTVLRSALQVIHATCLFEFFVAARLFWVKERPELNWVIPSPNDNSKGDREGNGSAKSAQEFTNVIEAQFGPTGRTSPSSVEARCAAAEGELGPGQGAKWLDDNSCLDGLKSALISHIWGPAVKNTLTWASRVLGTGEHVARGLAARVLRHEAVDVPYLIRIPDLVAAYRVVDSFEALAKHQGTFPILGQECLNLYNGLRNSIMISLQKRVDVIEAKILDVKKQGSETIARSFYRLASFELAQGIATAECQIVAEGNKLSCQLTARLLSVVESLWGAERKDACLWLIDGMLADWVSVGNDLDGQNEYWSTSTICADKSSPSIGEALSDDMEGHATTFRGTVETMGLSALEVLKKSVRRFTINCRPPIISATSEENSSPINTTQISIPSFININEGSMIREELRPWVAWWHDAVDIEVDKRLDMNVEGAHWLRRIGVMAMEILAEDSTDKCETLDIETIEETAKEFSLGIRRLRDEMERTKDSHETSFELAIRGRITHRLVCFNEQLSAVADQWMEFRGANLNEQDASRLGKAVVRSQHIRDLFR